MKTVGGVRRLGTGCPVISSAAEIPQVSGVSRDRWGSARAGAFSTRHSQTARLLLLLRSAAGSFLNGLAARGRWS
jgi:hypothetical protein